MKRLNRRITHRWAAVLAFAVGLAMTSEIASLHAQSLGLELGVAGVENYDPQPAVGGSVFLPVTRRVVASLSYTQWPGHDSNERPGRRRIGYGNRAFKLIGYYRLLGSTGFTTSFGGGVGFFEMHDFFEGARYEDALLGSVRIRVPLTAKVAPYVRVDMHVPNDVRLRTPVHWGFLQVGLDIRLRQ